MVRGMRCIHLRISTVHDNLVIQFLDKTLDLEGYSLIEQWQSTP